MENWDIGFQWNKEGVHRPFSMECYINQCLNDHRTKKKDLIVKLFEVLERHDLLTLSDLKDMYGHEFDSTFTCKKVER